MGRCRRGGNVDRIEGWQRSHNILVEDTGSEGTECSSEASLTATNWPPGRAADSHLFSKLPCGATATIKHNIYYAIYSSPPPLESSGIELEAWSSSSDRRYDPPPQPREAWRERRRARPAPAAHFQRLALPCAHLPPARSVRARHAARVGPAHRGPLFARSMCAHRSPPPFVSQILDVRGDISDKDSAQLKLEAALDVKWRYRGAAHPASI